jgi:uncharacterized membrane protein
MATLTPRANLRLPAAVEQQLEALSPRDRRLLVGLVLFLLFAFTGGFWYTLHSRLEDRASRVTGAKEALARVQELEAEYRAADAAFTAQKGRLEEAEKQPVTTWVEELANRHQLRDALSAVRETSREEVGDIQQVRYTVELKRAAQEPLYRFLYEVETSGFPAKVDTAAFRVASVRNEKLMDLTLDLVVLSLAAGGDR